MSRENRKMKSVKQQVERRKKKRRRINNIKKLFDQLRSESNASLNASGSSVLDISTPSNTGKKQRRCARETNSDNQTIIIVDDDSLVTTMVPCNSFNTLREHNSSPMHCSTPIASKKLLNELNTKANNNLSSAHNLNEEINNITKEINRDSFVTIDLTTETDLNKDSSRSQYHTVIDLANTSDIQDCTFVSVSNTNLSMSGDSDVTVLNNPKYKRSNSSQIRKFADGIAKLDASDKGRLLELITQNIFSGCNVPSNVRNVVANVRNPINRATETVEDTYIKEVILGQTGSRNSIGSNIYNPSNDIKNKTGLRMIVIDGSNVAMEHGRGKVFSVKGLKICIDYFVNRGHVVKAFVPRFRCKFGKSTEPRVLDDLERRGLVVYTPSREIQGKMITSYDDRYIVQCAAEFDAVIVSGDNYRDLLQENARWRFTIENRLLPFTWVNDMIMFPRDPLGRNGPTLERFLKHPQ